MQKIIHTSDSRGLTDLGWLQSRHSFSFGEYHDPARMNFGALRVLNDDIVAAGKGFGEHPHQNMEIISIPLEGTLEHTDSMGNVFSIGPGEIQVVSAGTGIIHAEMNKSTDQPVRFLQIWVQPQQQGIVPRYDQKKFDPIDRHNRLQVIISPENEHQTLQIHQDSYFSLGNLDAGREINYEMRHPSHGTYIFVIKGALEASGEALAERDALGISGTTHVRMKALEPVEFLVIEVPMNLSSS